MQTLSKVCSERVHAIYDQYINVISPFIVQLEVLDGEFPVKILNEIRAVFTHLSKYHLNNDEKSNDEKSIERQLVKAEGHITRAILDCYKYLCMAYNDKYKEFQDAFKSVDLSAVDNGEFSMHLSKRYSDATKKLTKAKEMELSNYNVDSLYEAFEEAYNAYAGVYNLIDDSIKNLEWVKLRTVERDKKETLRFVIGVAVGIVATILVAIAL